MTIDYIQNKRTRYVPPLRLFIFTLAIFIVVLFLIDRPAKTPASKNEAITLSEEFDQQNDNTIVTFSGPLPWNKKIRLPVYRLRSLKTLPQKNIAGWLRDNTMSTGFFNLLYFKGYQRMISNNETSSHYLQKKNKIKYVTLFFLVPLLAGLMICFFYKKGVLYYDMLVFSLNLVTFFMLVGMIVALVQTAILKVSSDYNVFPILYPSAFSAVMLHMIPGTKKLFKLSWLSTILRCLGAAASLILIYTTFMLVIEAAGLL